MTLFALLILATAIAGVVTAVVWHWAGATAPNVPLRSALPACGWIPNFLTSSRRAPRRVAAKTKLLVRAPTHQAAAELAGSIAEQARGGMFQANKVRRAAQKVSAFPPQAYDDAGF